jgi:hypothetical protein
VKTVISPTISSFYPRCRDPQRPTPLTTTTGAAGFFPSRYQGLKLRNAKDPVLYLRDPDGLPRVLRRGTRWTAWPSSNEIHLTEMGDPEIATRIRQYETAFRMQSSVPGTQRRNLSGE